MHVSVLEDRSLLAAPTGLSLSPSTVAENVPPGTTIGVFQSIDTDAGESFTYSLVAGSGDSGNSSFEIIGDQLRVKAPLNFEAQSSYAIRVRTTDSTGQRYEKVLPVTVTDVLEPIGAAIDVDPAINQVIEHSPSQSPVGVTISANAPDSYVTYSLLDDAGGRFQIHFSEGYVLVANGALLDHDAATSHTITVQARSSNGTTSVTTVTINVVKDTTPFAKPILVRDINQAVDNQDSGYPNGLVQAGSKLFYTVRLFDQQDTDGERIQLAVSNGTSNGTNVVAEFDNFIGDFEPVGETLYFINTDSRNGRELWKSDGTAAGTMIVKDIVPGPGGSGVYSLTSMNGTLYFTANDGASGYELWRSDGTAAGTGRVTDLAPGSASSFPIRMTAMGDVLYFMASDGVTGRELWASDGTAAGTHLVKDISPGPADGMTSYMVFSEHEGTLYFAANDGVHGTELWRSDGTSLGTSLVKDIAPGAASATEYFSRMVFMDGRGYFIADDGVHGEELFRTDGTEAGTSMVADISAGDSDSYISDLTVFGGKLYFGASNKWEERQLWASDGSASGTIMVKAIDTRFTDSWNEGNPGGFVEYKGTLYFFGDSRFWQTDGTAAGTVQVAPVAGYQPRVFNNEIYFLGTEGFSADLWKSDGTFSAQPDGSFQGTVRVGELVPGRVDSDPRYFTLVNGVLYFSAEDWIHGAELWRTDGTREGTWLVKDLNPGSSWSDPLGGRVVNGVFYFAERYGGEIWKSDGTASGTTLVQNFGLPTGQFSLVGAVGDTFILEVTDAAHGRELWTSDGTAAGTQLLMDIRPGKYTSYPHNYAFTGSKLYFVARDNGPGPYGIWKTDGTTGGTAELAEFPGNPNFGPSNLITLGETAFFLAGDPTHGIELWTTDGTVTGTRIVKDIFAGPTGSSISGMTVFGGRVFFSVDDGLHGKELWASDGTNAGTFRLSDFAPGSGDSAPIATGVLNGEFYFTASDGSHRSLWRTDGTPARTQFVVDLTALGLSGASGAVSFRGRLYFESLAGPLGQRVLASTDGTAAGSTIVTPVPDRTRYGSTSRFVLLGSRLVFAGDTDATGAELWAVDLNNPPTAIELQSSIIPENSPAGSAVGQLQSTDLDSGETFTYALVTGSGDDGNSAFEIVGDELRVRSSLDFESQMTYSVRVRTTDAFGLWTENVFSISVSDADEYDVANPIDSEPSPNAIFENAPGGSLVGVTAFASDADGTNNTITYSLTDNAGGRFTINSSTGVVMVANGLLLDRESAASHLITVQAMSADGSTKNQSFVINVLDVDEFNVTAPVDNNSAPNSIPENATSGTSVGLTAFASDADATNNTITYALTDNAGGRFTIDTTTGVVTVADGSLLNYEAVASHSVTVQATSTDGSTSTKSFTIQVADVNEPPTLSLANSIMAIDENSAPPLILAEINIEDDGKGTNQLRLAGPDASYFVLSGNHLRLSSSWPPDFELKSTYLVTIIVDDPSLAGSIDASLDFELSITDLNEPPIWDSGSGYLYLPENVAVPSRVGTFVFADDALGTNVLGLTGVDARFFQLIGNEVWFRPMTVVDFETKARYEIVLTVDDPSLGPGFELTRVYAFDITDVDEFNVSPISDLDPAPDSVPENSPTGTPVGVTAFASDADGTNNGITYSLWNTHSGRFAIDPATGVVTVANGALLNREAEASWAVTVLATSQDGSVSVKQFVVHVADVNEFKVGTISDTNPAANSIVENCPTGTLVGITGLAVDPDATTNAVTYSLFNTRGGRFAIDSSNGVITVANGALIDREAGASWTLTIVATSQDGSVSVSDFTINVQDVDEYDVGQVFDLNSAINSVSEDSLEGTPVGITGFGIDLDSTNSAVTYSLTNNAGGRFAINGTTGVITVANPALLDREASGALPSYDVTVQAKSQDGSSSTKIFTIQITDSDEFVVGLVSDINAAANTVAENSPAGTLVGITARATDADVMSNTIAYSLTNNAGNRFQIDPATGVVSVMAGAVLDFEAQTSWDITVRAASSDGSFSTQTFTISVTNVFDAPRVTLSNNSVPENRPSGTVVGTLGLADSNATSPVYTLVTGTGSTDNSKFSITGTQLKTKASFDFETKSSYSIRVQMKGAGGVTVTQVFTILVTNVNERPTGLTLNPASIAENNAVGATVGTLAGVDPDTGETLNYTLVSGTGSTDNAKFTISGNQLKAAAVFDYETKRSYSIRVRVTDAAGLTYEKTLTISVTNGPG